MTHLNNIDRRLPYRTSEAEFDAMAERIRLRTTARVERVTVKQPCPRTLRVALAVAAATVAIVAGVWFANVEPEPQPTLAELLATALPETLREVAATNYDDVIFNQF